MTEETQAQKIEVDDRWRNWFHAWWDADYSWDGEKRKRDKDGRDWLQDYFRENYFQPNNINPEDELFKFTWKGETRRFTCFHFPTHDGAGNLTEKHEDWVSPAHFASEADRKQSELLRDYHDFNEAIRELIKRAAPVRLVEREPWRIDGEDTRAKLDGVFFPGGIQLPASKPPDTEFDTEPDSEDGERTHTEQVGPGTKPEEHVVHELDGQVGGYSLRVTRACFCGAAVFHDCVFGPLADFQVVDFRGGADFRGADFQGWAVFRGADFHDRADFQVVDFRGWAVFKGADFQGEADFRGADFQRWADFQVVDFQGEAVFRGADFRGWAVFKGADFRGWAVFRGADFHDRADFQVVDFQGGAAFRGADFQGEADFRGADFQGEADFQGAARPRLSAAASRRPRRKNEANEKASGPTPPGDDDANERVDANTFQWVNFAGARFGWRGRQKADFSNRKFLDQTDFSKAIFFGEPVFHNTVLHQDTDFRDTDFRLRNGLHLRESLPKWAPWLAYVSCFFGNGWFGRKSRAREDALTASLSRHYRTLRLAMHGVKAPAEEGKFHALELHARLHRRSLPEQGAGRDEAGRIPDYWDDDAKKKVLARRAGKPDLPRGEMKKEVTNVEKFFILLYAVVSDYGQSLLRVLLSYAVVVLGSAGLFAWLQHLGKGDMERTGPLRFAMEQSVRPFSVWGTGYCRPFDANGARPWACFGNDEVWVLVKMTATAESLLSVILIALFFLVLRRKFQLS